MGAGNILGLLFEINADPSKAQEAIAGFEKQTGAALKNVSDTAAGSAVGFRGMQEEIFSTRESAQQLKIVQQELHRLMPQLTAEHLKQNAQRIAEVPAIQAAIEKLGLEKHAREELIALIGREMGATIRGAATESAAARQVAEAWEDVARRHGQLASSLERAEGATIRFGAAYMRAMALTENAANQAVIAQGISLAGMIRGRRLAAGIEAAWETAKGIAALAEWDFRGAALHFMSAAEYGIIAGTGSRHAPGASAGARAGEHALGPEGEPLGRGTARRAPTEGAGGASVHLNFYGPVVGAGRPQEIAEFLAPIVAEYVMGRDGYWPASHVKDSTLTRDSLNG